jgi:hypothetical protein
VKSGKAQLAKSRPAHVKLRFPGCISISTRIDRGHRRDRKSHFAAVALIPVAVFGSGEPAFAQTLSDKATRENLDLQEKCAVQAERMFKDWKADYEKEEREYQS